MASYKVAQDVEADDKLLGPFGFRQFIYLIIVAMAGILGYGLWQLLPPLAILPLPIIILFGALALPLRKDQPMETYLAAMVSYYLKPRKRLWQPDGVEHIVEITAPKSAEDSLTKDFGGTEADRRLSYLADIADSRGWAIRHAAMPAVTTSMNGDVYNEAQSTEDMLDDKGNIAQSIENLIDKADAARRQGLIDRITHPQAAPSTPPPVAAALPPQPDPSQQQYTYAIPQPQAAEPPIDPASVHYNPYPSIHQSVIQPMGAQPLSPPQPPVQNAGQPPVPQQPQPQPQVQPEPVVQPEPQPQTSESTSDKEVSPDIMNLANNSKNLSVETIAHEAKRLREKEHDGEVVISLR